MRSMKYVAAVLFMIALVQPVLVSAHASLVSSNPANGAVLTVMPTKVVAVYDEELKTAGPFVTVTNAAGKQVDAGDGKVDLNDVNHKTMMATLKPGLGAGTYTIHWKAITADDNGVTQGDITFTVKTTASTGSITSSTSSNVQAPTTTNLPSTGGNAVGLGWLLGLALFLGVLGLTMRRSIYRS